MSLDIKNIISEKFNFSSLARNFSINIPLSDLGTVTDVSFRLYGRPSLKLNSPTEEISCIENLHMLVNGIDVTKGLRSQIIQKLEDLDNDKYKKEYSEGANDFLRYITSFNHYAADFSNQIEEIERISLISNFNLVFSKIGDRDYGRAGNFHPFNFLYKNIDIKPLSLEKVIIESDQSFKNLLGDRNNLNISFFQNENSFSNQFDPQDFFPLGTLESSFVVNSKNPLEKPLKDIFTRLTRINKQIENDRINYLNPISNNSNKILVDIKNSTDRLIDDIEEVGNNIDNIG